MCPPQEAGFTLNQITRIPRGKPRGYPIMESYAGEALIYTAEYLSFFYRISYTNHAGFKNLCSETPSMNQTA